MLCSQRCWRHARVFTKDQAGIACTTAFLWRFPAAIIWKSTENHKNAHMCMYICVYTNMLQCDVHTYIVKFVWMLGNSLRTSALLPMWIYYIIYHTIYIETVYCTREITRLPDPELWPVRCLAISLHVQVKVWTLQTAYWLKRLCIQICCCMCSITAYLLGPFREDYIVYTVQGAAWFLGECAFLEKMGSI